MDYFSLTSVSSDLDTETLIEKSPYAYIQIRKHIFS